VNGELTEYAAKAGGKFLIALVFSAAIHMFLLFSWPVYRYFFTEIPKAADIEVTYLKSKEQPALNRTEAAVKKSESHPEISAPKKLISEETPKVPSVKKTEPEAPKRAVPVSSPPKKLVGEKPSKISIKEPVISKIQTAASVGASVDAQGLHLIPPSYSQIVRDRIIDKLDARRMSGQGDVYVRFVITSSGALKDVSIIEEKSSDEGILKAAAFEAVKNSAPFPVFPENVSVPEISFTCQITFSRK